ncbi:hypothetical protein [Lichenicola sp.]|uniref:hypothetical protein n=1 Tax=Lichenicola sp. TaxID=2804529 RepID=UPI003AFF8336
MEQHTTAETIFTALWARVGAIAPAPTRALAQELGDQAMQCIADTLGRRHEGVVRSSAAVLETLVELWAVCGLTPDEIWIELHKREQLGSLLMQLNQAQSRTPRRLLKPWKVDSTKLP